MKSGICLRPFDTILLILSAITPYLLVSGVFTFMYGFVPNTKVRVRAALIGGVSAGAAWAFFRNYVVRGGFRDGKPGSIPSPLRLHPTRQDRRRRPR